METTKARGSHPLGIATQTTILPDHHRLLSLSMRKGELLRSAGGAVWAQAIRSALQALLSLLRPDAHTRRASLGLT
jgi:hypothetical protein